MGKLTFGDFAMLCFCMRVFGFVLVEVLVWHLRLTEAETLVPGKAPAQFLSLAKDRARQPEPTLQAGLRPELVWKRTSPNRAALDGPVLYQILFRSNATAGFTPKIDTDYTLATSLLSESGGTVTIGGGVLVSGGALIVGGGYIGADTTVNGTRSANFFSGNGNGLSGVNAAALNNLGSAAFAELAAVNTFTQQLNANNGLSVGGDASMSSNPRMFFTAFTPGPDIEISLFIPDNDIVITHFSGTMGVPLNCTSPVTLSLPDSNKRQLPVDGTSRTRGLQYHFDSGPITSFFVAGTELQFRLGGGFCAQFPGNINLAAEYRMQ